MSALMVEGFDVYDTYLSGVENSLTDRQEWSTELSGGSITFPGGLNGGRQIELAVGDGVPGRYTHCRCAVSPSQQELCVGGLFHFTVADGAGRDFDNFILLSDTVGGETVSLSLNSSGQLVLAASLSGQSFTDPATTLQGEYHYYEIQVQAGTATLYGDNVLLGSVSVGGTVNFDQVDLQMNLAPPSDKNQYLLVDDFYITDFAGAEFVGRLGPIGVIPLIPTADGTVGTDMDPIPASPPDKYDKVDDNSGGSPTDKDTTHVVGSGDGVTQTFLCTAEAAFTGDALGFMISASCKSGLATNDTITLLVHKGASESSEGGFSVPIAAWRMRVSNVFTALPDASAMNQGNLETAEFGIRLVKP